MRHTKGIIFGSAVTVSLLIGLSSLLPTDIYSSAGWHTLWGAAAIALAAGIITERLWRNVTVFIMHLSFICMIAGGFCTSLLSRRGALHLLPDQTTDTFLTEKGMPVRLPEAVTLLSFSQEYYPGMNFPKDFRSELKTESGDTMHISMNHIGRMEGYRFYQASYDDMGGTVLTVSYDPAGITVTYIGFLLFAISGAAMLIRKARKRKRVPAAVIILASTLSGGSFTASAVPVVDELYADSLATVQVTFNGETVPFNTVATKLTLKLTGKAKVSGLSPEAFVASLIKYRDEWSEVPFLKIKDRELRDALGVKEDYASVAQLYDESGAFLPERLYEGGKGPLDKAILRLDEKVALLIDLWQGELFTLLEKDSGSLRSPFSIKSEIAYNRLQPPRLIFILTIFLAIGVLGINILRRRIPVWGFILGLGIAGAGCYAWLWSISPHIPLTDTSGMMEFTGIAVILLCAHVSRKMPSMLPVGLALLCASFLLLVAWLGMKDPVMTPVMPVLASPWLSVHVSLMMLAYAILGFTLPLSVTALIMPAQRERLSELAMTLLLPGTYLLGLGIITGAMWANVSWGRYWAWDPKETWSLVTLLLYSIPMHRYFGIRKRPALCCIYLIFAFSSILMTYFGVNYLPSLHAYVND